MGLGSLDRNSSQATGRGLTEARRLAHDARALLAQGFDPIEQRKTQRSEAKTAAVAEKGGRSA